MLARYGGAAATVVVTALGPVEGLVDDTYLGLLVDSLGAAKVHELLGEFAEHAGPWRDRLLAARAARDLPALRAAAHGLHGMAANLGLSGLAEATGALEEACVLEGADAALGLVDRADSCLRATLHHLRDLPLVGSTPTTA